MDSTRKLGPMLVILSVLATACGAAARIVEGAGANAPTQEIELEVGTTALPPGDASATEPAAETDSRTVTNVPLDFCFAYPEGFTQLPYGELVEVVGPSSGSGPGAGLMWMEVTDAQGRKAEEVSNEEVNAVGGLNPPRSTVMLGGEEALVLDGMPGQDAVRRVYIVHGGFLYVLTFSPYRSENATANAEMEALYASVTSTWMWLSTGMPCATGN